MFFVAVFEFIFASASLDFKIKLIHSQKSESKTLNVFECFLSPFPNKVSEVSPRSLLACFKIKLINSRKSPSKTLSVFEGFLSPFPNKVSEVSPQIIVGLFSKTLKEELAEAYLELSQTSPIKPFSKNSYTF